MAAFPKIHWRYILIGGFLAVASVWTFLLATPIFFAQQSSRYSSPLASMLACFLFAIWVARRADENFVLHGTLAAAVAMCPSRANEPISLRSVRQAPGAQRRSQR